MPGYKKYLSQMSPSKLSDNSILNNLKDHVDSGDVLFVVTGDTSNNQKALNRRCKSKCLGHRKIDRNFHSKVVDASQFVSVCDDGECKEANKYIANDEVSIKKYGTETLVKSSSQGTSQKSEKLSVKKPKRSGPADKIKLQEPSSADRNWKRKIILRQMKNHTISTAVKNDENRRTLMIHAPEKLRFQDVVDDYVSKKKSDSMSLGSENLSGLMNRIGLLKCGFKVSNKSPYALNEIKKTKRKSRSVIDIVPRHNCLESEYTRVPHYMGWHWTKCFSEVANLGWRPGAIPKNIKDIMSYFNGPCSCMPKDFKTCITYDEKVAEEQIIVKKPTLKVVRRDGLYFVCMNPLKPSDQLNASHDPYLEDCPPIKFQITLNRRNSEENNFGLLGYPCSGRPAICEENKEMQDLLKLLAEECENDNEFYKLAKTLCSKPSDLDIEFIAPGANLTDNRKETSYRGTQYDKNDIIVPFEKAVSRSLPVPTQN